MSGPRAEVAEVRELLAELEAMPALRDAWVEHRAVPGHAARFAPPGEPALDARVRAALVADGIDVLWAHQAEAIAALRAGRHVVVATPTASGKSLVYGVPLAEGVATAPEQTRALLIYPLKALARDQERQLAALGERAAPGAFRLGVYDGDTPESARATLRRDPPHGLITTPDMLHHGILPNHERWEGFFRRLRYVVLDEVHSYRGVFGSHVAAILRRLWRVARHHGAKPLAVASSGTIANPGELLAALIGAGADEPVAVIDADGAPKSGKHVLFLNPPVGASPSTYAARVLRAAMAKGLRTIVFTGSRRMTELLYTWVADAAPELRDRLSAYRAGYLPEERRDIEARLAGGQLLGVISTSALEAGIDIGGLDVCILLGYPGSVTSTWQRAGRVGRGARESLVVLVAGRDALDQYVVGHPDRVFGKGAEAAVCDPANPEVLRAHLPCAAAELPLQAGEPLLEAARARGLLPDLQRTGGLLETAAGGRWVSAQQRPHRHVRIREVGASVSILGPDDALVGTLSGGRALAEAHPGAVYLHRGETWEVASLDLGQGIARATRARVPYYTEPLSQKETEILSVTRTRPLGNTVLKLGRLRVTTRLTGFQRRHVSTRDVLGAEPLDLPPQVMETEGCWLEVPASVEPWVAAAGGHFMGAIHAVEHATIAVWPLFVLCDRGDVAGISVRHHAQVDGPAIFFYDGYPGGVGLCARAFDVAEALLESARDAIAGCPCEDGCPACIHSPRCGNGNQPLDKAASVRVLDVLRGRTDLAEVVTSTPAEARATSAGAAGASGERAERSEGSRTSRTIVFDLETQRSAEEVGGWDKAHLMRVAVGVACVLPDEFYVFHEREVAALLALLDTADLVVGFNCLKFDYAVLSAYDADQHAKRWPTLDLLRAVEAGFGRRVGLAALGAATLGVGKSADGLQSLRWWREGRVAEIVDYCRDDVALTRDLYRFGVEQGHVLCDLKGGERVRIPVDFRTPTASAATPRSREA